MFTLPADTPLRAFCISSSFVRSRLVWPDGLMVDFYDPTTAEDAPFCLAMNRANCIAYDGSDRPGTAAEALGMPLWVFLDCCTLPSAMVGFAVPRDVLPSELADRLDPEQRLSWIGISEYMGLPSLEPGTVVGVSLFSLARGARLGLRSKALGLFALGASRQVGVAQYTNPSVRLHLAFGDLELLAARAPVHSRPNETFVYKAAVPDAGRLAAMVAGRGLERRERQPLHPSLTVDPRDPNAVERLVAARGKFAIVGAGAVVEGLLSELHLAALPDSVPSVVATPSRQPHSESLQVASPPAHRPRPLLVIGCGYAGEAIARAALREGREVWGTTRNPSRALELAGMGVEPIIVDFERDAILPELVANGAWEVVVTMGPEGLLEHERVLERALDWAAAIDPVRVVYLSATSVLPGGAGEMVDDTTPPAPVSRRGEARRAAETRFEAWASARSLSSLIVRLPGIYGPGRTQLPRIREGSYRIYNAALWSNRVFIDDIASGVLFLLPRHDCCGALLLSDGHPAPITEVCTFITGAFGLAPVQVAAISECPATTRDFWEGSRRCHPTRLFALGWRPLFANYREGLAEAWRREADAG